MINNLKSLGYYIVGGEIFYSKIAACIKATQTRQQIQWVFKDEQFDKFDWTKEPPQPLSFYYKRRAQQIRDMYDYVIISYSGGSDSHNIVQTFLDNNLAIDEIVVNTYEEANKSIVNDARLAKAENYGAEYKLQIYPRLEEIRLRSPNTKITIVDQSEFLLLDLLRPGRSGEWALDQREVLNPSGISRYNYLHNEAFRKRVDKFSKVCLVLGAEKPITYFDTDDNYYMSFVDTAINMAFLDKHFTGYDNTSVEFFYWGDGCAELIAKQSFAIKKWIELNPQHKPLWLYTSGKQFKANIAARHVLMRSILYDNWNSNWFQVNKGRMDWYDSLDEWFYSSTYNEQKETWRRGLNFVTLNAVDFLEGSGLRPFMKTYFMGKMHDQRR